MEVLHLTGNFIFLAGLAGMVVPGGAPSGPEPAAGHGWAHQWITEMERAGVDGFTVTANIDIGIGSRRRLKREAIKPWQYRPRLFPRDPEFAAKAGSRANGLGGAGSEIRDEPDFDVGLERLGAADRAAELIA